MTIWSYVLLYNMLNLQEMFQIMSQVGLCLSYNQSIIAVKTVAPQYLNVGDQVKKETIK